MIRSMTGFGQATVEDGGITVSVEISSLNHRHLDIGMRLPPMLSTYEIEARKLIQGRLERGRINVLLTFEGNLPEANQVEFNESLAEQYLEAARNFVLRTDIKDDLSAVSFLRLGPLWTLKSPCSEELAPVWDLGKKALDAALDQLLEMRETEGKNIWDDLSARIQQIVSVVGGIEGKASTVVDEYRERLKQRIDAILPAGTELDEQRLLAEVALFADKADIAEELTRLDSHLKQFTALAEDPTNVGRRLDFLLQEMFREITTIGSKARDAEISHSVVEVKGLLEKMREQVQNVE